jgi:LmbE family N-acetylglucosaminyl deacetylase
MKFLNLDRVLCLSPHPDDVEYSMSGTICKYKDTKFDILCLTQGTSTDISSNETRLTEVRNFWEAMGLTNVQLLFSEFKTFEEAFPAQWITSIENSFGFPKNYDGLLCTSSQDSHYEHLIVNGFSNALCRSKTVTILEYKSPSTLHTWIPNLFVNIEHFYKMKLDALRSAFLSQLDSPYFSEDLIKLFHVDYLNQKRGSRVAEEFRIVSTFQ